MSFDGKVKWFNDAKGHLLSSKMTGLMSFTLQSWAMISRHSRKGRY